MVGVFAEGSPAVIGRLIVSLIWYSAFALKTSVIILLVSRYQTSILFLKVFAERVYPLRSFSASFNTLISAE